MSCARDEPEGAPAPCASAGPSSATHAAWTQLAEQLFKSIEPHLGREDLEVECRLCTFASLPLRAPPPRPASSSAAVEAADVPSVVPTKLRSREKIIVGVSEADFKVITDYIRSTVVTDSQPMTSACTEDVQDGRRRTTFTVAPDGSKTPTTSISKKRLCVVDMAVPGSPYDIRLSVNVEEKDAAPTPAPTATTASAEGDRKLFSRLKRRQSVQCTEDAIRYDLTSVVSSNHQKSFEVEMEGCFKDQGQELTRDWVRKVVMRMVSLATMRNVSGQRAELSVASGKKRRREDS